MGLACANEERAGQMKSDEFTVGLDLGTTKACAVIARQSENIDTRETPTLHVLGVGEAPSTGLKKGVVVNIEETVESIRKAIQESELQAGVKVHRVVVGVAGSSVEGFNSTGVVGIKNREIDKNDIERVIDAARAVAIPADRMALHVLAQEYKIDGQDGIREPLGMMGTRLEAKVHIVTAARSATQNLIRCCEKTGLMVSSLVLQPLASAEAVLSRDEKDLGVALVDIGGGTTDLAIFHGGCIIHTSVLPIGGSHITQDLAIGLRTPQLEAEKIKREFGCALREIVDRESTIEVPSVGGRPSRVVEQKLLGDIIEPRMEEIFQLVNREIISSGCADILGGGVVLTGGATQLRGVAELAEFVFDLPVKLASPDRLEGFSDIVSYPNYSTAVGLARWAAMDRRNYGRLPITQSSSMKRVKKQFKNWMENFF